MAVNQLYLLAAKRLARAALQEDDAIAAAAVPVLDLHEQRPSAASHPICLRLLKIEARTRPRSGQTVEGAIADLIVRVEITVGLDAVRLNADEVERAEQLVINAIEDVDRTEAASVDALTGNGGVPHQLRVFELTDRPDPITDEAMGVETQVLSFRARLDSDASAAA